MQKSIELPLRKQDSQPTQIPQLRSKFSDRQKRKRSFLKLSRDLRDTNGTLAQQLKTFSCKDVQQYENEHSGCIIGVQQTGIIHSILNDDKEAHDLVSDIFEQAGKKESKKNQTSENKENDTDCSFQSKKDGARCSSYRIQRKEFMYQKLQEIDQKNNFLLNFHLLTRSLRSIQRRTSLPANEDVSHDFFYRKFNLHSEDFFQTGSISSEEFEKLPHAVHHGESRDCQICMDQMVQNDQETMLFCSHSFHSECIEVWLRNHVTCPLCKLDIRKQLSTSLKLLHAESAN